MTDREALISDALAKGGWGDWRRAPLAGDASRRRYERLTAPDGRHRILMDAPPEVAGDIRAFLDIGAHLRGIGLRAPGVDLADRDLGLIVMEDFGDDLLARRSAATPAEEPALYAAAAEVLAHLQSNAPVEGLPHLDATEGVRLVAEVADWLPAPAAVTETVLAELDIVLRRHLPVVATMALRDYHAENIVLCGDGAGLWRLGLLDFQDAVMAAPVYDLVSLIRDVRRDVSEAAAEAATSRFATLTGTTPAALAPAVAAQGAQRNLRILGIFHRLARRDGKLGYLDYLPRLHRLLRQDLGHPDLSGLARAAGPLLEVLPHDA